MNFVVRNFQKAVGNPICRRITSLREMTSVSPEKISTPLPVAGVVQMTTSNDKESNWLQGKALVEKACSLGAQMVFLPECFDYVGTSREETLNLAETEDGEILKRYRDMAQKLGVWLSLGGMHEKPKNGFDGKLFNTHFIINSSGDVCGKYSKTHLFDVDIAGGVRLKETDFVIPGSAIGPPVTTPVGAVGVAICYDLRFPELSTALTQQGAQILTYPSAFTVSTGMAHWQPLLRSRAIENQCYVIAAAQVGKHNEKRASYGHSMVVDPWGCVVTQCSNKVGVCIAEIDTDLIDKLKREMPVQSHRRHDLYGHITVNSSVSMDSQESYVFGHVKIEQKYVFYRTALTYAFVNLKPVLPGHVLISSIRPAERFADLTAAEVSDLFLTTQRVTSVVEEHFGGKAATVALQDGEDAGQTVKHVHVHVLPRKPGDFQRNDDIYEKLEHHDKDMDERKVRTDEEMTKEAQDLRKYFV